MRRAEQFIPQGACEDMSIEQTTKRGFASQFDFTVTDCCLRFECTVYCDGDGAAIGLLVGRIVYLRGQTEFDMNVIDDITDSVRRDSMLLEQDLLSLVERDHHEEIRELHAQALNERDACRKLDERLGL